jgi:hypothetical protein
VPPGVNVTTTVHEAPLLTVPPTAQLPPVTANCFAVASAIVPIRNGAVPVLLRVSVRAVGTVTAPKFSVVVPPRLSEGAEPLPCIARLVVAAPPAASATRRVALRVPGDAGVNSTAIGQLAPAAKVTAAQPFEVIEKLEALPPAMLTVLTVIDPIPVLV